MIQVWSSDRRAPPESSSVLATVELSGSVTRGGHGVSQGPVQIPTLPWELVRSFGQSLSQPNRLHQVTVGSAEDRIEIQGTPWGSLRTEGQANMAALALHAAKKDLHVENTEKTALVSNAILSPELTEGNFKTRQRETVTSRTGIISRILPEGSEPPWHSMRMRRVQASSGRMAVDSLFPLRSAHPSPLPGGKRPFCLKHNP